VEHPGQEVREPVTEEDVGREEIDVDDQTERRNV
jgi:hypothetical protein